MYAVDGVVCPDGRPHQPKYDHLTAMHAALAAAAPALLAADAQVHSRQVVDVWDATAGAWVRGDGKLLFAFVYAEFVDKVVFLENNVDEVALVRFPADSTVLPLAEFSLSPLAVAIVDAATGVTTFDSAAISDASRSYARVDVDVTELSGLGGSDGDGGWRTWRETLGAPLTDPTAVTAATPLEQSALSNFDWLSEYAWYETNFSLPAAAAVGAGGRNTSATTSMSTTTVVLEIDTQMSNGFVVFVDGEFAGTADDHQHQDGNVTLAMDITISSSSSSSGGSSGGSVARERGQPREEETETETETEQHTLQLLSESFGFHNLIGRWGSGSTAKTKGITGNVSLGGASLESSSDWRMRPALHGETYGGGGGGGGGGDAIPWSDADPAAQVGTAALWSTTTFSSSAATAAAGVEEVEGAAKLFLDLSSLGRGHAWVNGHDLGRFWDIERAGGSGRLTQKFYHIPSDFLVGGGGDGAAMAGNNNNAHAKMKKEEEKKKENTLVVFDALGGDFTKVRLVRSHTRASTTPVLVDEVDSPASCLSS
jgi:hypothetical protein